MSKQRGELYEFWARNGTFVFPGNSPTELKADPFLGTKVLHGVDDWIIREAERWPNPWQFLLNFRGLPPAAYDLFRAAESLSRALNRVQGMLFGGATRQRTLLDEMQKEAERGNKGKATRLAKKLVRQLYSAGLLENGDWRPITKNTRRDIDRWIEDARRSLVKRHGRKAKEPSPLPTAENVLSPVEYTMISNWLRWGIHGEPGLCYYTDEAMADLMVLIQRREQQEGLGTRTAYYRKIRQRLQLAPAYYRNPIVRRVRSVRESGELEITLVSKEGAQQHRLSSKHRMVIRGRQYYPIPQ